MKHNLSISVSKKPVNHGVLNCRNVTVRERFLRFLFGDRVQLTVLVPGRSVQNVYITEVQEERYRGLRIWQGLYLSCEKFTKLLAAFDSVIDAGICVVVTAHAKMRKFEQPDEMGAYDRWEMKLSKQTAPLFKEWCDMLLFCNYQTYVVNSDNDTKKAQSGKRVIFTTHHPCWDAKNRHNLPSKKACAFLRRLSYTHRACAL